MGHLFGSEAETAHRHRGWFDLASVSDRGPKKSAKWGVVGAASLPRDLAT